MKIAGGVVRRGIVRGIIAAAMAVCGGMVLADKIVIDGLDWASSEPKNLVTGEASGPLKFIREAVELPPLPEGAFTYAVFGDTQCYDKLEDGSVTNRGFTSCINWILANKDSQNIIFVSHLGDIVDRPDVAAQWEAASAQMKRLDDAGMRYGVAVGNHDMTWGDVSVFSQYFPASRYESYGDDYESFGGFIGTNFCKNANLIKGTSVYDDSVPCDIANICGNNGNSLQLFSAAGEDFIVFHLQCSTPQPVIDWVDEKLTEYADRTAIIVDHEGLGLIQEGRPYHDFGDEINFGRMRCHRINSNGSTSAQSQWEKCYSKHPNLMMVLSGHEKEVLSMQQTVRGDYGNDVVEVCMNYPETPESDWMRIYRFVPSENKVYAYTLSPRLADGYGKICVGDEVDFTDGYDKPTYATNRVHHFEIDRTRMRDAMTTTPAAAFAAGKVNVCDGRRITGNAFKAAGIPDLAMVQKVNLSLVEEDGRDVLRVEYGILNDYFIKTSHFIRKVMPSVMIANGNARTLIPGEAIISGGEATAQPGSYRIDIDPAAAGLDAAELTDAVAFVALTNAPIKGIIVDTDIGSSIDDLFALEAAVRFRKQGEAELLGVIIDRGADKFAEYTDAFMNYYGLGHIPLGRASNETARVFVQYTNALDYAENGANFMQRTARDINRFPDAVKLYRRLLADAPDNSVDICAIGFFTALNRLMDSEADEFSPLNGMELIAKKVGALRIMAGSFDGCLERPEYNVMGDVESARRIFTEWPTRIVCTPFEIGIKAFYPVKYIAEDYEDAKNPVRLACLNYTANTGMKTDMQWDTMAMLGSLMEDGKRDLFSYSKPGKVSVDADGFTTFSEAEDGNTAIQSLGVDDALECRRFMRYLASGEAKDSRASTATLRLAEVDAVPLDSANGGFVTITNISSSEEIDLSGVSVTIGAPEHRGMIKFAFPTDGTAPVLAPGEGLRMERDEASSEPDDDSWMSDTTSNVLIYDKDGYILQEAFIDARWFNGTIYGTGRFWSATDFGELVVEESQAEAAGEVCVSVNMGAAEIDLSVIPGEPYTDEVIAQITEMAQATATRHGRIVTGWANSDGSAVTGATIANASDSLTALWSSENPLAPETNGEGAVAAGKAQSYDCYILDADGNTYGTAIVKVGKRNAKSGMASVKATVKRVGESKSATFKATEAKGG